MREKVWRVVADGEAALGVPVDGLLAQIWQLLSRRLQLIAPLRVCVAHEGVLPGMGVVQREEPVLAGVARARRQLQALLIGRYGLLQHSA